MRDVELVVAQLVPRRGEITAADLGEAGHAGGDAEAIGVVLDLAQVPIEKDRAKGAGPGEVHLAAEHVDQLGNLVELRPLQELADRRVEVVLRAQQASADLPLRPLAEGAELEHGVELLVFADTHAAVEERTLAAEFYGEGDQGEDRRQEHDRDDGEDRLCQVADARFRQSGRYLPSRGMLLGS